MLGLSFVELLSFVVSCAASRVSTCCKADRCGMGRPTGSEGSWLLGTYRGAGEGRGGERGR